MDLFQPSDPKKNHPTQGAPQWHQPLATRMRPQNLDEFIGQEHLVGEGQMLRRMIESRHLSSVIMYGPPSSGKTTLAHVIAREMDADFVQLNAVLDGLKEFREVVKAAEQKLRFQQRQSLLFVDEIHRWNKAQQDALLPHIESGTVRLIGATTENPFYALINPLLSRCQLFELYPLTRDNVLCMLERAINDKERGFGTKHIDVEPSALAHLADYASGDVRQALNALEMAVQTTKASDNNRLFISLEVAKQCIQKRQVRFDRSGDEHYHMASAFIKSLRGSDTDASLYWMSALLESGEDPDFIFRRLYIFASEDIGMAEPYALSLVHAAHQAFERCGMPEGLYFLSHCCIYLSLCPKSNSTKAIFEATQHIKEKGIAAVPDYLKDKTANAKASRYLQVENASKNYRYPHNYDRSWVNQAYLPEEANIPPFYIPRTEGREAVLWERIAKLKQSNKSDS